MADKKQRFSALLQIYRGSDVLEDLHLDPIIADGVADASALAVTKGDEIMRRIVDNHEKCGIRVLEIFNEKGESMYGQAATSAHRLAAPIKSVKKDKKVSKSAVYVYKPFSCPIVSFCTTKYSANNKYDGSITMEELD